MSKSVQISYFAIFREQRGLAKESYATNASTMAELYGELKTQHGFTLPLQNLRVARNSQFVNWDAELSANDEIAFIPPVAGG